MRTQDVVVGSGDAAVEAYVVEPADGRIRAGILFLHWLGEHRSDRTQFLSEARDFARLGVRCVLPAGRLPWVPDPVDAETDVANIELEQRRLGAALDRLAEGLPKGTPLALVGHDFGAMHGLLLVARRPEFAAAVIIAATPRWADWFLRFWKVEGDRFDYLRRLAPYDPVTSARLLKVPTLWQFSERDYFIAADERRRARTRLVRCAGDRVVQGGPRDAQREGPRGTRRVPAAASSGSADRG